MKLNSCLRSSAGAALGMVAAALFIILAIGLFFYYAGSLFGGGNELNRASDAGILSVAKQALVQPAVALNDPQLLATNSCVVANTLQTCPESPVPYNDFAVGSVGQTNCLADQNVNGYPAIDLITYNRCAAQAVLVGLEAQKIGTTTAYQHSQAVCWAVLGIGKVLQQRFAQGGLDGYYDNAANLNTLDMLGHGTIVSRNGNLKQGYVNPGRASNIYFYSDVSYPGQAVPIAQIPQNTASADPKPDQTTAANSDPGFPAGETVYYAQGYEPITVMPGTPQASLISFVPDNPQATPHAIDLTRVEEAATPPFNNLLAWVPPNAFQANSKANVDITGSGRRPDGTFVNAISCAMIGCGDPLAGLNGLIGGGGGPQDQPARIPGGFLRLYNLPGMEQISNLPLGPVPGQVGGDSVAFDASGFILNNAELGGLATVYFATPIQYLPNGNVDLNHTVFGFDAHGKAAMQFWIRFNKSRSSSTADVIHGQQRDPALDGNSSPNSSQILASGRNPHATTLREGPVLGQKAVLSDMVKMTGYVDVHSLVLDGVTPVNDSNGQPIAANVAMAITTEVAGSNLGQGPPHNVDITVPFNNRTWTWVEYLKYKVIQNYARNFSLGHFSLNQINAAQQILTSGQKFFKWWDARHLHRVYWSSPNNYLLQTTGSNRGLEIPSSSQFMTVGTPANLFSMMDEQIQDRGGYVAGQTTYDQFITDITNRVRLIRPSWSVTNVVNALNSQQLAPGSLMYLRDDGNGNLIMTNTCPQDTGVAPEGTGSANAQVIYVTMPGPNGSQGQTLEMDNYVINTQIDGSLTAYTADANTELQPWRTERGSIFYESGAVLYNATGYNNLVGQVNFFSRPAQDLNVSYAYPN